jgi:hypothetical protein
MELTSAFNSPAAPSGADTETHGETGSNGDAQNVGVSPVDTPVSSSPASSEKNVVMDAPPRLEPEATEDASDFETIHPEAQALNDAQDRRLADEARISDENMRARREFERHLERMHDIDIRQLQGEIRDLQSVLESSGPIRLAWLQITHQVPAQPHRHLDGLHSMLGMCQDNRAQDLQAFEERVKGQASQARALSSAATQNQETQDSGSQDRNALNKREAAARLAYLEDTRSAPVSETHLRPGGRIEEFVHFDVAARREAEISALKAFMKAHDGPDNVLDNDPRAAPEQDLDDGFDLSF